MGSRRDKDGGPREESQGSPSVMVLGGLWFALCSTLVWTRFENINVFFSFVTAIACRAICGALIRNQGLASSLVGCVYSLLHSVLTLATWVAHSAWVEDALLVSSTGYVCMTLFDQMMSGLMRDRVDEIMIKDNAVMLSLLTAQYHRELRLPYMSLISLTFLHHLWFHALDAYIEIFERPSSFPTKLPRSHLALSAKRLPYAAASRAVLVLFQGIPRSIALLSLLRDSWGIPGFLAKFDTVEIVGSALGVMLLNVLAVSALEANSYLSLDSHGRQRKGALSKKRRLWTIAGKTYDLSSFVPKHPGGEASILLGQEYARLRLLLLRCLFFTTHNASQHQHHHHQKIHISTYAPLLDIYASLLTPPHTINLTFSSCLIPHTTPHHTTPHHSPHLTSPPHRK
uniref:Cytochrome b5 heme-binding domain-containing protein n=1 Tax=Lotharella globosa TaxID=91324 RepID=A0A7S3YLZ8_9EUKA